MIKNLGYTNLYVFLVSFSGGKDTILFADVRLSPPLFAHIVVNCPNCFPVFCMACFLSVQHCGGNTGAVQLLSFLDSFNDMIARVHSEACDGLAVSHCTALVRCCGNHASSKHPWGKS